MVNLILTFSGLAFVACFIAICIIGSDTEHYDNDMDEAERQGYFDE